MLKVQIHSHPYYQINNSHFGYNLVQNCSETLIGFVWAVSYSKNSHPGKYRGAADKLHCTTCYSRSVYIRD